MRRLRRLFRRKSGSVSRSHSDVTDEDREIAERVAPYTMTSLERRYALIEAVRYAIRRPVPGAFVECGVWRGGSALAILLTLQRLGVSDRDVWLYDTFSGMTKPSDRDRSTFDPPALDTWMQAQNSARQAWHQLFDPGTFSLDRVRALLAATGYPEERIHLVPGPVEQTLTQHAPGAISLLRLDTDWYESTRHELEQLYPRLSSGGILIVDDYGHWQGCREAVDEYFSAPGRQPVLLTRIDYTGRLAVKS